MVNVIIKCLQINKSIKQQNQPDPQPVPDNELQLESALKTEAVGLHIKLYIVCIESILCTYCL